MAYMQAAMFLSEDDTDTDEDLWEPAPFHAPPIAAHVPMPPPGLGWGDGGFIPGRGFVQFPVHPALQAQVPILQP